MNKIDALLKKHCPQGVEIKTLGEVLNYTQPTKYIVSSEEYKDDYSTPVLTAGDTFVLGYTNETEGIYNATKEIPVIIFDDFTTSFHWVDFDFKVKSSAMKMLTPKENILFRYVYYAMKNIRYNPSSHARQWISKYSTIKIPVPPMEVQREIVEILDTFTELKTQLEEEIKIRDKQYHHYSHLLLDFSAASLSKHPLKNLVAKHCKGGVEIKTLGGGVRCKRGEKTS